jgi:hypothetical protein
LDEISNYFTERQVEEEGLLEVQVARQREFRLQQQVSNRADAVLPQQHENKAVSKEEEANNTPRRHISGPRRGIRTDGEQHKKDRRRRAGRKR